MKKRIRSSRRPKRRGIAVIVSLLLLMLVTVGGTLAYLVEKDAPITNVFSPANVDCEVVEVLNGTNEKTSITVRNTGDIDAYIRLQFISYRIDDNGNVIGGETAVNFNPSNDWIKVTDPTTKITHYYYKYRVQQGGVTSNIIATNSSTGSSIVMQDYTLTFDAAGNKSGDMAEGKQVIEVIAEAIQADGVTSAGTPAVTAAWKIEVDGNGNLTPPTPTTN